MAQLCSVARDRREVRFFQVMRLVSAPGAAELGSGIPAALENSSSSAGTSECDAGIAFCCGLACESSTAKILATQTSSLEIILKDPVFKKGVPFSSQLVPAGRKYGELHISDSQPCCKYESRLNSAQDVCYLNREKSRELLRTQLGRLVEDLSQSSCQGPSCTFRAAPNRGESFCVWSEETSARRVQQVLELRGKDMEKSNEGLSDATAMNRTAVCREGSSQPKLAIPSRAFLQLTTKLLQSSEGAGLGVITQPTAFKVRFQVGFFPLGPTI